jgi:hypothetical protein
MRHGIRSVGLRSAVALLLVFGAILLALSLGLGWYTVSATYGSDSWTESFYFWGVQTSGTGSPGYSSSYSGAYLPQTGSLYATVNVLVGLGVVAGLIGGALLLSRWNRVSPRTGFLITILGSLLIASVPILLLAAQPSTVCADSSHFPPGLGGPAGIAAAGSSPDCSWEFYLGGGGWSNPVGDAGPGATFLGQVSQNGGHESWAPGLGWLVSVIAGAFSLVACLLAVWVWRAAEIAQRPARASQRP